MKKICFVFKNIFLVFALLCCNKNKPSDYMEFDRISCIDKFPRYCHLENSKQLDLNLMGVRSLSIQDSILIVSTIDKNGYWSFFRLSDYTFLGKYLTEGKSDNEFLASPRVEEQYFIKHDGMLFVMIYDFYTGKILVVNITETLQKNRLAAHKQDYKLPRTLFNFIPLDSFSFFCREANSDHTKQLRFILRNGEKSISENMETLNKASIESGYDCDIIGTFSKYNPKKQRIVEAAFDLNIINLYSIDDTFRLTICSGGQLDNIKDVQNVERRKKKVMYEHLVSYDDYFGVLYQNDTNENIHYGKARSQTIQFFNWDGKPLVEAILDKRINSFDIDFTWKCLYALSYEQDEVYVYDIKEILEYLEE